VFFLGSKSSYKSVSKKTPIFRGGMNCEIFVFLKFSTLRKKLLYEKAVLKSLMPIDLKGLRYKVKNASAVCYGEGGKGSPRCAEGDAREASADTQRRRENLKAVMGPRRTRPIARNDAEMSAKARA